MKNVAYYNKDTGILENVKRLPERVIELNCGVSQEFVILGDATGLIPGKFRFDGESFVPYVDLELEDRKLWSAFKAKRDRLLMSSDWAMLPDAPTNKQKWGAYRQALRDLPETVEDISNVQWPDIPT